MHPFDTPQEAARAGLAAAMEADELREYAGVIYEKDGKYYYTQPKSSGKRDQVKVKVQYPKGSKLHGLYHTHPEGKKSHLFSHGDIEIAEQLKMPYYMAHAKDKSYHVFTPGSKVNKRRDREWNASGEPLGSLYPETTSSDQVKVKNQKPPSRGWTAPGEPLEGLVPDPKAKPQGLLGGIQEKVAPDAPQPTAQTAPPTKGY